MISLTNSEMSVNPRRIVSANKSLIYYHFNLAIKANQKISMVAIKLLMLLYVTHSHQFGSALFIASFWSTLQPAPDNHPSAFCLCDLTLLGTSYKWNHTILVLLCLAYFT